MLVNLISGIKHLSFPILSTGVISISHSNTSLIIFNRSNFEIQFELKDIMVGLGTPTIEDNLPSSYDFGDEDKDTKDDEKEENEFKDFDINTQLANKDDNDDSDNKTIVLLMRVDGTYNGVYCYPLDRYL
jgi:hypothetical protein